MGALDCVGNKLSTTDSTEVFTVKMNSETSLNETVRTRRDPESQLLSPIEPSCKNSRVWWRVAIDIPLLLLVMTVVALFEFNVIPQHRSGFFCNDPALSFPYNGDTVCNEFIIASIFLFPLVLMLVTEYMFLETSHPFSKKMDQAFRKTIWLYRNYICGLFFNFALVEVMKGVTGSPRPTFFDICEPDTGKTCNGTEFVSTFQCTSKRFSKWLQNDSFHSFPSGHTSLSIYCGLFMAWYLQRRAFDWRHRTVFTVPLLQMLCLTYSAVSSLTRITDRRHHWWDVLTGALIGLACVLYVIAVLCNNFSSKSARGAVDPRMTVSQQSVRTLVSDGRQSVVEA